MIVSAGKDRVVKLWDLRSGQCMNTLAGHSAMVCSVGVSDCGFYVISGGQDSFINVWTREQLVASISTGSRVLSVKMHGTMIVSGQEDSTVKVWKLE